VVEGAAGSVRGSRADPAVGEASRLERARGLLRRLEDRHGRPGAEPEADGRLLPVVPPLTGLLPWGGLRRGSTVVVTVEGREGATDTRVGSTGTRDVLGSAGAGATSLLLAVLAGASAAGAWAAVVGRPELGLVAAAEAGVALERLALVPYPGADLVAVTAALLDGLDLVAVSCPPAALRAADRQRLAARARQRGAVLVAFGSWPGADVELGCVPEGWQGVDDGGGGRLRARRARVRLRGRVAPTGHEAVLLLPGADGRPAPADPAVPARLQEAG
jgi:hypothetical protein